MQKSVNRIKSVSRGLLTAALCLVLGIVMVFSTMTTPFAKAAESSSSAEKKSLLS